CPRKPDGNWGWSRPEALSGRVRPDVDQIRDYRARFRARLKVEDVCLPVLNTRHAGSAEVAGDAWPLALVPHVARGEKGRPGVRLAEVAHLARGRVHDVCVVPSLRVPGVVDDLSARRRRLRPYPCHAGKKRGDHAV